MKTWSNNNNSKDQEKLSSVHLGKHQRGFKKKSILNCITQMIWAWTENGQRSTLEESNILEKSGRKYWIEMEQQ